ncbi:MAG: hypothetical protein JKY34_01045 [Kordiimonadaceae bacterium]|nr:hypothetical protein [Kordiimonadaceae bacterium]
MSELRKIVSPLCTVLLSTSFMVFPAPSAVSAQEMNSQQTRQQLEDRVQRLEQELQAIKNMLMAKKTAPVKMVVKGKKAPEKGKKAKKKVRVALKPTPKFKSADGSFVAKFVGFGQMDSVFQNNDTVAHPNGTTVRRARLGLAGKAFNVWGYKFLYEFANNNKPSLQDMFITYKGFKNVAITLGQAKEPVGLEWQSPSKYWTFMELPVTTSLTPRRSIGTIMTATFDKLRFTTGLFGENANKTRTANEGYSIDIHMAFTPFHTKTTHLHGAVHYSYRVPDDQTNTLKYGGKHETSVTPTASITTGNIGSVDHNILLGGEMLWVNGPFSVQAEYTQSTVSRDAGFVDEKFQSYYVQGSWFLTGESKNFNPKKYGHGRIAPHAPFKPGKSDWGALELAFRYGLLDLHDNVITGGSLRRFTGALNWHPNTYTRFSMNYTVIDTDSNAVRPNDNSKSLALRAQIDF